MHSRSNSIPSQGRPSERLQRIDRTIVRTHAQAPARKGQALDRFRSEFSTKLHVPLMRKAARSTSADRSAFRYTDRGGVMANLTVKGRRQPAAVELGQCGLLRCVAPITSDSAFTKAVCRARGRLEPI
jgi:hypothetical protein